MTDRDTGESASSRGGVIAATKLQVPIQRPGLVPRGELITMLNRGADQRLTVISAPAGSGKTTLLAQWCCEERDGRHFAWLSLDPEDNDPVRFWTCVIGALRIVQPGVGAEAEAALRAPGTSLTGFVAPIVINELVAASRSIVLAVDDYHLITDQRVHESLGFFVEHLPATVHVALASRTDPPLPLPRLRARGQLTELRARDLRFTDDEAAAALSGFGLSLDAKQVARLQRRTEGWAAGIQLAALTLRDRGSPDEFIARFAGDDRQIVDYLGAEVLAGQDPVLLAFMLRTSILDSLSAPLCAAVTGEEDCAARLDQLDRGNLFVIRLDDRGRWYRYHALFAQLLRSQLKRDEPRLVPELHRLAAAWYREQGAIGEAIRHALAGGEPELAVELTAAHWPEFFNLGFLATVAGWLDALPRATVAGDSRLWLARVWTAMDQGHLEEAETWLELGRAAAGRGEEAAQREWVHVLRALHRFKDGDVDGALEQAGKIAASDGDRDLFRRTVVHCVHGVSAYWSGRRDEARAAFERAERLADADGNALGATYALGYLGWIEIDEPRLAPAERALDRASELVRREPQVDEHFAAMAAHLARGRLAARRGSLSAADSESDRALELARRGAGKLELTAALLLRAEVLHAQGPSERARELLAEAERLIGQCRDPGIALEGVARARSALGARAPRPSERESTVELSERELGVLRMLPSDLSLREIGGELYVSVNTVKTHVRHIYAKLDAADRDQAVARARSLNLL